MKRTEEFLSVYKEYEAILRDRMGTDAKSYEDSQPAETQGRLRMLRYFRNYLSHQDDPGFLEVTEKQLKFMKDFVSKLKAEGDTIKKHLSTPAAGTVSDKDRCSVALEKCAKLKSDKVVVVSKSGYGVASIYDVIPKFVASKTNTVGTVKLGKSFCIVPPTTEMSKVPDGVVICTQDGTPTGKLVGVAYR